MNDVERKLRQLGEKAERDVPGGMTPRPKALKRIRLRRRFLSGSLVLCTAVAVAGGVALSAGPRRDVTDPKPAEKTADPDKTTRCGVSFEPTYLPRGFEAKPRTGSGGGGDLPAEPPHPIAHFRGPLGSFVDVRLAGPGGFSPTMREPITVLGRRGSIGNIHEGYQVAFEVGRCRYELLAYGLEGREVRWFAEGLVSTTARGPRFGAVWPEDTIAEARHGCTEAWRGKPDSVATEFGQEMLRWVEPAFVGRSATEGETTLDVVPSAATVREPGIEPGVRLTLREILPDCWSVVSASPLGRRVPSLGISVRGRIAEIVFPKLGATSATIEFGYGSGASSMTWHKGDGDMATVHVGGPGRRDTGHFLILFREVNGDPFTALGRPLPPGDFAAG